MATRQDARPILELARRWVEECLLRDGSVFDSDGEIWTLRNLRAIRQRFTEDPDPSSDPFLTKLSRQLDAADDDVIQLMAEILYVHLLVPDDIGGPAKRDNIEAVLSWAAREIEIPDELDEILDMGLVKSGIAYKTYRPHQLWLLIDFVIAFKELDGGERNRLLEEPWGFKEFLFDIPFEAAYAQREAILYLVHPETFEDIISRDHKKQIVDGYAHLVSAGTDDVDRALLEIRTKLEEQEGEPVNFYDDEHLAQWNPEVLAAWDGMARWAPVFLDQPGWEEGERDYKIETGEGIAEVREDIGRTEEWPRELVNVINRLSNLVHFTVLDDYRQWMEANPEEAAQALETLWDPSDPVSERVDRFADRIEEARSDRGAVLSLASVLLMAEDATSFPPYRQRAVERYFDLCRRELPPSSASFGEQYAAFLALCDEVVRRLEERGLELRDRLDAQSVLWSFANAKPGDQPLAALDEDERSEFLKWRGDEVLDEPGEGAEEMELGDEKTRRRHRISQIVEVWRSSREEPGYPPDEEERERARAEAQRLLEELTDSADLDAFARSIRGSDHVLPHIRSGSHNLFLQGIAQHAEDTAEAARRVADAFRAPADEEEAIRKIEALTALTEGIGTGSYPAAGMSPLAASAFWYLQDPSWPWLSAAVESVLATWGWLEPADQPGARYLTYRDCLTAISADDPTAMRALSAISDGWSAGLDPSLVERCQENQILRGSAEPDGEEQRRSYENIRTLVGDLKLLGQALRDGMCQILDREVQVIPARAQPTSIGTYRADGFVALRPIDVPHPTPDLRIWASSDGVAIGLHPGMHGDWYAEARRLLEENLPRDMEFLHFVWPAGVRVIRPEPDGAGDGSTEFLVGRWYPHDDALARPELVDDVLAIARLFRPAIEQMIQAVGGTPRPRIDVSDDPLAAEVRTFVDERGYPDARAREERSERVRLARALQPDLLRHQLDRDLLGEIIGSSYYGRLTDQAPRERSLRAADDDQHEELRASIHDLLWGSDDDAQRFDDAITDTPAGDVLDEELALKLLAIVRPDRYLPILRIEGPRGKRRLLERLGLPAPREGTSLGTQHVGANDELRSRLEVFFPGDTLGMAEFLQWYSSREEAPADDDDRVAAAAAELLVDEDWLREIVDLLYEKRQVIFYGPPGTGKTYLARRLANALVRDGTRTRVVQFHPSYSYEDFFEGYRPVTTEDGEMRYELRPGPLAQMVEQALDAPGADHVMVIDEINRANLPKVFGELLYLLEYRDDAIQTQYRDRPNFTLPKRLYFIGTMNTADRSIALVDAALRRRFHFVPFFPHEGQIADLLRRWLGANDEPEWVADFLDFVNARLRDDLGGPHLQVGPSHFMREDIDEEQLRRVWRFSVFPYIEEQLFGDQRTIERYRYEVVREEYQEIAGPTVTEQSEDDDDDPPPEDETPDR